MALIAVSSAVFFALVLLLFVLVRKNSPARPVPPVTADWLDGLSMERYRPMMRLLDHRDVEFLRSQPGFTAGMISRLRAQRAEIFRDYLAQLSDDFRRVCTVAKLLMLQSRHDRPDLAGALLRQQLMFTFGMWNARVRLTLYKAGICGVDVTELVRIFDGVRFELRLLVPSGSPAAA